MRDEYGNKIAGRLEDGIDISQKSARRGGVTMECDYGFVFLENYEQTQHYFELRRTDRKKEAAKYLNHILLRRRIVNPRRKIIAERPAGYDDPRPETISSVLHRLVDIVTSDGCFGFLTEEDIDNAITLVKTLSNSRMTYEQAASEIGCSVPALHTKVCRHRIKTEHVTYLRRHDVDRLKKRKVR